MLIHWVFSCRLQAEGRLIKLPELFACFMSKQFEFFFNALVFLKRDDHLTDSTCFLEEMMIFVDHLIDWRLIHELEREVLNAVSEDFFMNSLLLIHLIMLSDLSFD
jgi:hypothetical protein